MWKDTREPDRRGVSPPFCEQYGVAERVPVRQYRTVPRCARAARARMLLTNSSSGYRLHAQTRHAPLPDSGAGQGYSPHTCSASFDSLYGSPSDGMCTQEGMPRRMPPPASLPLAAAAQ